MDAGTIGGILAGLTTVIAALGTAGGAIAVRLSRTSREQRHQIRDLRRQVGLLESYVFVLTRRMRRGGMPVPNPPKGLWNDDDAGPPHDDGDEPRGGRSA